MPKKVLYISELADLGGGERSLISLITGLDRRDYAPHLLCAAEGALPETLRRAGVPVSIFPFGTAGRVLGVVPYVSPAGVARFHGLLRSLRPDLVHTNCFSGLLFSALPAELLGIPVVWSDHGWTSGAGLQGMLIDRFCSGIGAVSRPVRDFLLSGGRIPPGKVALLPPSVDGGYFGRAGSGLRSEFGISPDAPLVGIVGRLQEVKGHRLFLQAAARIRARLPAARFLIVGARLFGRPGDEPYEAAVAGWIKEYGLEGKVVMAGFRGDMPAVYSALDVMVCASRRESFCLAVAEAMSCEVPVVSTRCGGPEEIIENGVSGVLVPPADPEALAKAVLDILADGRASGELGLRGRERVKRLYSPEAVSAALLGLYDGALKA